MIQWISRMLVPLIISYIVGFGLLSKRPVFDDFLKKNKNGIYTATDILPTLVGLMTAVGVLRSSGFLDALSVWLTVPAQWIHLPAPLIPLTLVRLVSNSAATGLVLDIFTNYGPDSFLGMAASIMMSSTETVFYCISIYFGSVHVTKSRYTLPGAMIATIAGITASILLAQK